MAGSAAAKQALLSVGDVLLEVDGTQIDSEDQLKEAVSKPNDRVTLKVGPNLKEKSSQLANKLSVSSIQFCCSYFVFILIGAFTKHWTLTKTGDRNRKIGFLL